jgi:hypothetical protein
MQEATRMLILAASALILGALQAAEPGQVRAVYLLPMANGFDQYLAHQLTAQGVLQVVTDPARADAVLTDRIGPAFERRLEELFPPEKPAPTTGESEKEKESAEAAEARAESDRQRAAVGAVSSFGRGRGNIFLVARASREVLWSVHQPPKNFTPRELDRAAAKVAAKLKATLSGK